MSSHKKAEKPLSNIAWHTLNYDVMFDNAWTVHSEEHQKMHYVWSDWDYTAYRNTVPKEDRRKTTLFLDDKETITYLAFFDIQLNVYHTVIGDGPLYIATFQSKPFLFERNDNVIGVTKNLKDILSPVSWDSYIKTTTTIDDDSVMIPQVAPKATHIVVEGQRDDTKFHIDYSTCLSGNPALNYSVVTFEQNGVTWTSHTKAHPSSEETRIPLRK